MSRINPKFICPVLHLPPLPGHPCYDGSALEEYVDYATSQAELLVQRGFTHLMLQNLGDRPVSDAATPETVAAMSVVGHAIKRAFPCLGLGIHLMANDGPAALAVAKMSGAQFVRLRVMAGAMVKPEGIKEGCAYAALSARRRLGANNVLIYSDVYDSVGVPVGRLPIEEAARQCAFFARADGLILKGRTLNDSINIIKEVSCLNLGIPLIVGGGVRVDQARQVLEVADGFLVATDLKENGNVMAPFDVRKLDQLASVLADCGHM